jgi:nucleoside-diphosphate-sugar epimerase
VRVFITGANSFLGSNLAVALRQEGYSVLGSARSTEKLKSLADTLERGHVIRLGEPFGADLFRDCVTVIHCAHDFTDGAERKNINGTIAIAEAARSQGVSGQIFLSTYSAHEGALSEYARAKFALEKHFLEHGETALRLGLIVGNGGLYQRISASMKRLPIVPLIDGGRGELPILSVADFIAAVKTIIRRRISGLYRLYLNDLVTLREVATAIRAAGGYRSLLLPIPFRVIYSVVWVSRKMGLRLPIDLANLQGYRANQDLNEPSDLLELVAHPLNLEEMIKAFPE